MSLHPYLQMERITEEVELQQLLATDEYDFLLDCGVNINASLDDKMRIKQAVIKHYCIYSCKAELDQLLAGLNSLGVGDLLKKHPHSFLALLVGQPNSLTAETLQDMMSFKFSIDGSNIREQEEEAAMHWITFLSEIDDKAGELAITRDGVSFVITLADILKFVTATTEVPPMGFMPNPTIHFSSESTFPIASTCANTLTLPLGLSYDTFRYNVAFGIQNSPGFLRI